MSLNFINPVNTIISATEDEIWYSNPSINIELSSTGEVRDKLYGNAVTPNYFGYYPLVVSNEQKTFKCAASFNSLFSRVVLGVPLKSGCALRLKIAAKGYVPENVETFHVRNQRVLEKQKQPELPVLDAAPMIVDQLVTEPLTEQYYTLYEAKNEHTTEDGAVFPTLELAQWHQEKVSKGKGNAQVVLDYNGGYVLAEQIYFQEVVYNKEKPYTNFVDVLNNNQGIVSNVQDEHYKFDKLKGYGLGALSMFGLNDLNNLVCSTKTQAEKINTYVNQYSKAFKELDESIAGIKKLISLVK